MKTYHATISKSLRPAYFERIKQIEQRAETEQQRIVDVKETQEIFRLISTVDLRYANFV